MFLTPRPSNVFMWFFLNIFNPLQFENGGRAIFSSYFTNFTD